MLSVCHRYLASAAAFSLLLCSGINASTITKAPQATVTPNVAPTCEFRTINYITDSLPQLCFKSSWSNANGTSATSVHAWEPTVKSGESVESTPVSSSEAAADTTRSVTPGESASAGHAFTSEISSKASAAAEASATDLETGELNDESFLSFEEWKKRTLEKAGQADVNIGKKRSGEGRKRDSTSFQNHLDSIGEEGEIDIDLGFGSGGREGGKRDGSQTLEAGESEISKDKDRKEKERGHYRSPDAGKTCKERFSYASFDAGATILKTHPGAKNSKAVLIENKDSYMLSECSAENKFIVVELSEDIWIDTVVLANYEFFSSMIRTFRVSVSDRYPVKIDKWKDVGTFEARNSRDIQAFLIENPQIWARYIRIDFLSHYGNEYYCPLSLVRVHGTRMLESWKESEAGADDEENDESEEGDNEDHFVHDAVADTVKEEERLIAELKDAQARVPNVAVDNATEVVVELKNSTDSPEEPASISPWETKDISIFFNLRNHTQPEPICLLSDAPVQQAASINGTSGQSTSTSYSNQGSNSSAGSDGSNYSATPTTSTATHVEKSFTVEVPTIKDSSSTASSASDKANHRSETPTNTSTTKAQNGTHSVKNKTTNTSSASSSLPTIQDSFFKAVSRRLNFLESNSTLSLKYIEEQSRILREAFQRVEKKQMQKTTVFLETLNSTVLDELRGFRQQYDEIWQSTVISLESQREASQKEFLAISSRLNILADEVVFQKRMSIVQSVLLLLCLGLVIFSRVSGAGQIDVSYVQSRLKSISGYALESPLESPMDSPAYHRTNSLRNGRWLEVNHKRQRSDDTVNSRSRSRENSPPTPISTDYRSEDVSFTPPSAADELSGDGPSELQVSPEAPDSPLQEHTLPSKASSYHSASSPLPVEGPATPPSESPIPVRSSKRRKPFIRQQFSPSQDEDDWPLRSDATTPPSSEIRARLSNQHLHPALRDEEREDEVEGEDQEEDELQTETRPIPTIHLPSPPPENVHGKGHHKRRSSGGGSLKPSFSIARKPLPALPLDGV